ncbi:MAG: type III pantothenate kinase [Anaerolineales bacterium]|nr:type III pantothenate kinase [Anaerolineales bacterium]
MLLTIDIGNTNVTLGLYQGEALGPRWRLATDHHKLADEYGILLTSLLAHAKLEASAVQGIAVASVVPPLTGVFVQACESFLGQTPFVVDAGVKTGVRIRYDDPKTVGADRVVDAAAVQKLYGGPACVVDLGTATTFDAISAEGDYLGGAIAPGIGISADALAQRTSKLTRVDLARPPAAIGRNTVHAIQSGLIYGHVGLIEGMVARFRSELGPSMKVIATGGLASLIANEAKCIDIIAPWLTLEGLRIVWELNHKVAGG